MVRHHLRAKENQTVIELIVNEEKPNQREKIHIRLDRVKDLIPKDVNPEKAGDYIVAALEHYKKHLQMQKKKNVR